MIKWLIENFAEEPHFIKELILSKSQEGETIFRGTLKKFDRKAFFSTLLELKEYFGKFESYSNVIEELLLIKNEDGKVFIQDDEFASDVSFGFDDMVEIINWIKINCKIETIDDFLHAGNDGESLGGFIIYLCTESPVYFLKFLNGIDQSGTLAIYSDLVDKISEKDFSVNDLLEFPLKFNPNLLEKVLNMKKGESQTALLNMCLVSWLERKKENLDAISILHQIISSDLYEEDPKILFEILSLLVSYDSNALREIIKLRDNEGRNLVSIVFSRCVAESQFSSFLKKIIKLLENNKSLLTDFELKTFLLSQDINGNTFLGQSSEFSEISANFVIDLLKFLTSIDSSITTDILNTKNKFGRNLLSNFSFQERSKQNLSIFIQELFYLLDLHRTQFSDFDFKNFLLEKDNDGRSFFQLAVCHDPFDDALDTIISILELLMLIDPSIASDLLETKDRFGRSLLSTTFYYFEKKSRLKNFFEKLRLFFSKNNSNLLNLRFKDLLREFDNDGVPFLHLIIFNDPYGAALDSILDILKYLIATDPDIVCEFLNFKDLFGRNFISRIFYHCKRKIEIPNFIHKSFDFFESNKLVIPNFDYEKMITEIDNYAVSCLHSLVFNDNHGDSPQVIIEILNFFNSYNSDIIDEILSLKDPDDRNVISTFCFTANPKHLPKLLPSLFVWYNENGFDLLDILQQRNAFGDLFLNEILKNEYFDGSVNTFILNSYKTDAFKTSLETLKKIDSTLFEDLLNDVTDKEIERKLIEVGLPTTKQIKISKGVRDFFAQNKICF